MIPKKVTLKSCVGKRAIADRDISNQLGTITAGSRVRIISAGGRGVDVRNNACAECGVQLRVNQVPRDALSLIDDEMEVEPDGREG